MGEPIFDIDGNLIGELAGGIVSAGAGSGVEGLAAILIVILGVMTVPMVLVFVGIVIALLAPIEIFYILTHLPYFIGVLVKYPQMAAMIFGVSCTTGIIASAFVMIVMYIFTQSHKQHKRRR